MAFANDGGNDSHHKDHDRAEGLDACDASGGLDEVLFGRDDEADDDCDSDPLHDLEHHWQMYKAQREHDDRTRCRQHLLDALADAMCSMADARVSTWVDQRSGKVSVFERRECPSLHQLLLLRERLGYDPTDADATKALMERLGTQHRRISDMIVDIEARLATIHRVQAWSVRCNVGMDSSPPSPPSAAAVEPPTRVGAHLDLRGHTWAVRSMFQPGCAYRAGNMNAHLVHAVVPECENWLRRLAAGIIYCIQQEREDWTAPVVDEGLVRSLGMQLAKRSLGISDGGRAYALSDRDFDQLLKRFVPSDQRRATAARNEVIESLQWLVELCDARGEDALRRCLDQSRTPNGRVPLLNVSTRSGTPTELKEALSSLGVSVVAGAPMDNLWHALQNDKLNVALLSVREWCKRFGAPVGQAARRALWTINSMRSTAGTPFVSMLRKRDAAERPDGCEERLLAMPALRHVVATHQYDMIRPRFLQPHARMGLDSTQMLSLCIIDVVWELLGKYGEAAVAECHPKCVQRGLEVCRHEALLVRDFVEHEIAHRGRFVDYALDHVREQTLCTEGDLIDVVADASHKLRNHPMSSVVALVNRTDPCQLHDLATALNARMKDRCGANPFAVQGYGGAVLMPTPWSQDATSAQLATDVDMSVLARTPSQIYTATLPFQLLSFLAPCVAAFRQTNNLLHGDPHFPDHVRELRHGLLTCKSITWQLGGRGGGIDKHRLRGDDEADDWLVLTASDLCTLPETTRWLVHALADRSDQRGRQLVSRQRRFLSGHDADATQRTRVWCVPRAIYAH